ncbi:MAG: tRNA lysidine(34) synthetase TilS, partial [Thermoleophilia bacterium]
MARADATSWRLERRVAQAVAAAAVLRPGEHALLMLSGGADSMALLDLLPRVDHRLGLGLRLAALHVDYGRRGAASERDCEIVRLACAARGVPLHIARPRRLLSGADFQARAREYRYRRARELAAAHGYDVVVTAHNRDDQAETILYRLTKYASPRGLVGMRPRDRRLARPLLCLAADEIRAYCGRRGVEYGEDATNAQPVYARNLLRLEVLPVLARINPRVARTLADTAGLAAAEAEVVEAAAAAAAARVRRAPAGAE